MSDQTAGPIESSPNDFKVGDIVFDKYKIVRFINSGGNGRVYRATDVLRNVDVALKVLVMHHSDKNALIRFHQEARTASKLKHPNIATIYDFNVSGSTPYLVMEFIDGESLEERLSGGDTLDFQTFCDIFFQLSLAVEHAHKHSIVHRDLKPQNVMIASNSNGTPKVVVLDFGVAKVLGEDAEAVKLTGTGGVVGSPLYMSPEQAAAKEVTTKSDLYSIGAMMFRSLVGKPPLQAATAIETVMLVASSSAPPIGTFDPEIPKPICQLVDDLLSRDPAQRPSLKDTVIPTLQSVADSLGGTLEAPTVSSTTHYDGKRRVSNKRLLIGFCILATILGAASIFAFKDIDTKSPSEPLRTDFAEPFSSEKESNEVIRTFKGRDERPSVYRNLTSKDFKAPHGTLIDWENSDATDAGLLLVPEPKTVTDLRLHKTKVETLKALPRFVNLKRLYLGNTKISDKALENIVHLPLDTLDLEDTSITDKGLQTISKIKTLEHLILSTTEVTASGFKYLKPLNYLRDVYLNELVIKTDDLSSNALNFAPNCSIWFNNINEVEVDKLRTAFPDLNFHESLGKLARRRQEAEEKFRSGKQLEMTEATSEFREIARIITQAYGSRSSRLRRPLLALATGQFATEKTSTALQTSELQTAVQMSREANDEICEYEAWTLLSAIYAKEGRCAELRESAANMLKTFERSHENNPKAILTECLDKSGQVLRSRRCVAVARELADKGLKIAKSIQNPDAYTIAKLYQIKGAAAFYAKDYGEGVAQYRKAIAKMDQVKPFTKQICVDQIGSYAFLSHCEELQKNYEQAFRTNREARKLCRPGIPYDSQLLIYGQASGLSQRVNCSTDEKNSIIQRVTELKTLMGIK